jgi:ParB-like chromosome segregation protein Spo0J
MAEAAIVTNIQIKIKKEYQELVPEVSPADFQTLKDSIARDGLLVPIIVNKSGIVLDGHHRFKACNELGIALETIAIAEFDSELAEQKFVIDVNLRRRQLNSFQRDEIFLKLASIEKELAAQRKRAGTLAPIDAKGKTAEKLSTVSGLSARTLEKVTAIIKKATPEALEKLRAGSVKIDKVYKQVQREEKRHKLIFRANKSSAELPDCNLIQGDFSSASANSIAESSVDLIFTDPPYDRESIPLYGELAKLASRVLEDGGSLLTYAGHYTLPSIFDLMKNSGLTYWWIIPVLHAGPFAKVFPKQVTVTWKPLLWFVKGTKLRTPEFIRDSIQSELPDKDPHDWAQSTIEAEHIISKLTIENDVVLDPMMGSGTTGIAALKLNRKFVGIEKDKETFEIAISRIMSAQAWRINDTKTSSN